MITSFITLYPEPETWTAFEQLVSEILWMEGYWVRTSVKVELTKEEKRLIGRHSSPRWELDIVAYNGRDNLLRVVECKSYFDSVGATVSRHARAWKCKGAGHLNPATMVNVNGEAVGGDPRGGERDQDERRCLNDP